MTRARSAWGAALRVVGLGVVLGLVVGALWFALADPPRVEVTEGGIVLADPPPVEWFSVDGWFLLLGVAAGLTLSGVAVWRGREHPVASLLGVAAGTGLMTVLAWQLGTFLGPDPIREQYPSAEPGDVLQGAMVIRASGVLVAPLVAAVGLYVALLLAVVPRVDPAAVSPVGPPTPPSLP